LQVVFCDQGVPSTDGSFNVYDQLKRELVARGVPEQGVRFIQEAKTAKEKERLFEACRQGHVHVLIGSTQKMGVGTNIQRRMIHLLHLDPPWRPADIDQREGRELRPGNLNPQVMISTLICEGTYDTYMWQTLARKYRFIGQLMNGTDLGREVENIDDAAEQALINTAVSSGNPMLIERIEAEKTLRRYTNLYRDYQQRQDSLALRVKVATKEIAAARHDLPLLTDALARTKPTAGDSFCMQVHTYTLAGGASKLQKSAHSYMSRKDAASYIESEFRYNYQRLLSAGEPMHIATLGGHNIMVSAKRVYLAYQQETSYAFSIEGVPCATKEVVASMSNPLTGSSVVSRLEHLVAESIPAAISRNKIKLNRATHELEGSQELLGKPFPHSEALTDAQANYRRIVDAIAEEAAAQERLPASSTTTTAEDSGEMPPHCQIVASLTSAAPARPATEWHSPEANTPKLVNI
jgi:hypothetical protein